MRRERDQVSIPHEPGVASLVFRIREETVLILCFLATVGGSRKLMYNYIDTCRGAKTCPNLATWIFVSTTGREHVVFTKENELRIYQGFFCVYQFQDTKYLSLRDVNLSQAL